MGGPSGSADRRTAVLAVAWAAITAAACTATSPPPLPPRRVDFSPPAQAPEIGDAATAVAMPIDLPAAAEPPLRDERYMGWTLAADAVSLVALGGWLAHRDHLYLMGPWLLLTPAIHAAHGELRSAGISVLMRAASFGLLYAAGHVLDAECRDSRDFVCLPIGAFVLAEIAVVLPVVVDATHLARTRRPAPEWHGLPLLGATAGPDGRRLFTLTARF